MTTQAMYDNGTRCRGKGFNCPTCKMKNSCVEYVDPNKSKINKPEEEKIPAITPSPNAFDLGTLSDDERDIILKHRLKTLTTTIDNGQYSLILSNAESKVMFGMSDNYDKQGMICYLNDNQLDQIYNFLATRHKLSKKVRNNGEV